MSRITRRTYVVSLCAVALAFIVSTSAAQPRAREGGIRVYDDVNFRGATVTFRREVPDLRDFDFNDRISSFQVATGEVWEVCEDSDYRGRCQTVSGSERDLRQRGWNDKISSMRPRRGRDGRDDRNRDDDPRFPR